MKRTNFNCTFDQCPNKAMSRGLCVKHYTRWRRYGDVHHLERMRDFTVADFWKCVSKLSSGCWEWQRQLSDRGYGRFQLEGKQIFAHRYAFFLTHGEYPSKLCLHSCDNPRCVNPDHLRDGTHQDNHDDMVARGRERHYEGTEHRQAKLSKPDVLFIRLWRKRKYTLATLANTFQVSIATIRRVASREGYRNI